MDASNCFASAADFFLIKLKSSSNIFSLRRPDVLAFLGCGCYFRTSSPSGETDTSYNVSDRRPNALMSFGFEEEAGAIPRIEMIERK